jgi:1-acyl-sn-glycerol-3-phosphate acyltransferase
VLISANHRSLVDPVIVHTAFPWRRLNCLATKALYNTPLKAWFFNKMHCIEVDKENFSMASFHQVVDVLGEGRAVVIFPEGQLNNSTDVKTVLTFKSGVVLMAHKGKAPILPIYIEPRTKWYKRQRVAVGLPIEVSELLGRMPSIDELCAVSDRVRECELQLMEYLSGEEASPKSGESDTDSAKRKTDDTAVEV